MSIFAIDFGHTLRGLGTGAAGIMSETAKNREIGNELIAILRSQGHTVINCTVDVSNNDLADRVSLVNKQAVDFFVSIHLNAGGGRGTETYIYNGSYSSKTLCREVATRVNNKIVASCNFVNRGVKENNFYVIRETVAPAILIEVCFVDSQEDSLKLNCKAVANAIAEGLTNTNVSSTPSPAPAPVKPVAPAPVSGDRELNRYKETGTCTVTTDKIYFRNKPYIGSDNPIIDSYCNGESVYYDLVVITEKYVWISWISASTGIRRYMPIKQRSNNESWANCV